MGLNCNNVLIPQISGSQQVMLQIIFQAIDLQNTKNFYNLSEKIVVAEVEMPVKLQK